MYYCYFTKSTFCLHKVLLVLLLLSCMLYICASMPGVTFYIFCILFLIRYMYIDITYNIGNMLTIAVIMKYPTMQTYTNMFVASLAFTDIVIAIIFIPTFNLPLIFGEQLYHNRFYNLFRMAPFYYTQYLQLMNLVAIAVDR